MNETKNFTWLPFFNAMLKKICSEYDKRTLWEVFKKVYAGKFKWDLPILTENPGEIDPFTFIAMLNSNDKKDSRIELCQVVKEELNISEAVPLDFDGIVSYPPKARFFYTFDSLDVFYETIDSLWKLAQCVVGNDEITNDIGRKIDVEIEDINEQFFLSWVKICKILFICFPDRYFPADTKICAYSGIKSRLDNFEDFKKYQQALKDKFNEPPYIVSYKAINGIYDNISYNVQNTEAKMTTIKQDTPLIPLNQILYGPPGTGKTYNTVIKAMEIINPDLIVQYKAEAITYDDVKKAFDEAKKNGQIEFVTFHQSYAYEEFVEGIKPDLEESEDLKYELKDGIFKRICKNAETPIVENKAETGIRDNPNIWKISLNGTENNEVKQYCMDNDCIRVSYHKIPEDENEEFDFERYKDKYLSLKRFKEEMEIGDIVLSCSSLKTIDAIGVITGEYQYNDTFDEYKRCRKVKWLVKGLNYNILKINSGFNFNRKTFHRVNNMSFNDILPLINSEGQVVKYTENRKPYVLIIDEINRGNISKIFGELITLIEPDKRQGAAHEIKAKLPYSQFSFAVPQNLYIIGTMNTSDRSIAAVDIALRRRFKFIEMMPDVHLIPDKKIFGIDLKEIFKTLNERISILLDRDHQIGHSYFMNLSGSKNIESDFKKTWFDCIMPLLNEYFYCDWEKLRALLGEAKKDGKSFIKKIENVKFAIQYDCDDDDKYDFVKETDIKFEEALKNAFQLSIKNDGNDDETTEE